MRLQANGILGVMVSVSGAGLLKKNGFRKRCENEKKLRLIFLLAVVFQNAIKKVVALHPFKPFFI
jgi:hypothetical protein